MGDLKEFFCLFMYGESQDTLANYKNNIINFTFIYAYICNLAYGDYPVSISLHVGLKFFLMLYLVLMF